MPAGKGGKATLTPVDELPTITREAMATVSAPVIDEFMESGHKIVKVTREQNEKGEIVKAQSTKASLKRYVETRELPIKVFVREGDVYLQRQDLNGQSEG